MRIKTHLLAAVLVAGMGGVATPFFTITTPNANAEYGTLSPIPVTGNGAFLNSAVAATVMNNAGVIEAGQADFANGIGHFAITVDPPVNGWSVDGANENHKVEVENQNVKKSVNIKIVAAGGGY